MQESLGFSPSALVFGHLKYGQLKLFEEDLLSANTSTQNAVLDFVTNFHKKPASSSFLCPTSPSEFLNVDEKAV